MTATVAILMATGRARFSVSVDHDSVNGYANRTSSATTSAVTATPLNGQAPYAAQWNLLSQYGVGSWSVTSPTSLSTSFTCDGLSPGDDSNAVFSCTVTDSIGDPPATSTPVTAYAARSL